MPLQLQTTKFLAQIQATMAKQMTAVEHYVAEKAVEVHADISAATPVDTGALRASWQLQQDGQFQWRIMTHLPYAVVVEYGLYRGVGEKTIETGYGIFSRQAPSGAVRISLEKHRRGFVSGAIKVMREAS